MAKKIIDTEKGTVTFDFSKDKGTDDKPGSVFTIAATDVPGFGTVTGTALHALLHGLSQKIGDAYANAKTQPNPLAWAQEQVKALIASIVGGVWNAGRTGEGAARVSILARALCRIKLAGWTEGMVDKDGNEVPKPTDDEAQKFVDSLSLDAEGNETKASIEAGKARIAEYKSKKKVARMLDTIRLEDAAAKFARAQAKVAAGGVDDEEEDEGDAE